MRAAIIRGNELVVDEIANPVPEHGEVLVKTLACGICGSDLHALKYADQFSALAPDAMTLDGDVVMGHEFCAEILEHGADCAKTLPVGSRVCAMPVMARGSVRGAVGYSNAFPGGYGEQMLLLEPLLLPVPNGLSTERAALTEPMAVGLHAVEMARIAPGEVPLVIGCGPVGLAVINALKMKDAHPIVAADFSAKRRELAAMVGADVVIDPSAHSPYETWTDLAGRALEGQDVEVNPLTGAPDLPAGVFFECVGVPGVIDQMMVGAQRGCRFVVVGVCMEQDHIRPLIAVTKELSLQFVLGYTADEFANTLRHIAEGEFTVEPLITGKVGVDGVSAAFDELTAPDRHAKILVEPWR